VIAFAAEGSPETALQHRCMVGRYNFGRANWSTSERLHDWMGSLGVLARIHYPAPRAGGNPETVDLTWNDFLTAARMLRGELTPASKAYFERMSPVDQVAYLHDYQYHAQLILWTVVNRNYHLRNGRNVIQNFSDFMKGFSQPINPAWLPGGSFCRPGSRAYRTRRCSPSSLASRVKTSTLEWHEIPELAQSIVLMTFSGRVSNPNPWSVDFAQRNSHSCQYPGGRRLDMIDHIPNFFGRGPGHAFCGSAEPIDTEIVPVGNWVNCLPHFPLAIHPISEVLHPTLAR
jgi:hypothetical protein